MATTLTLVLAGCSASQQEPSLASPDGRTEMPTAPVPSDAKGGFDPVPESAGPVLGANFTDCSGATIGLYVPAALVRGHIPPEYEPVLVEGQLTNILLKVDHCQKVSVEGRDQGTASFERVVLEIVNPAGTPQVAGIMSYWVAEIGADNTGLQAWLNQIGMSPRFATVNRTVDSLPGQDEFLRMGTSVNGESSTLYTADGPIQKGASTVHLIGRYFFGPNPERDFFEENFRKTDSGASGGRLTMSADSAFAELLGGTTEVAVSQQATDVAWREWQSSSAVQLA